MFVYLVICNKSQQNYEYDKQTVATTLCLPSDDLFRLVCPRLPGPRRKNNAYNEAVESKSFCENEDENHAHE